MKKERFAGALALLIGGTIGAGIFSLPFALKEAGSLLFLTFFFLAFSIVLTINLFLAEIAINIEARHRLPGYVLQVLGKKFRPLLLGTSFLGGVGGILAYIILGSLFLKIILFSMLGENPIVYAGIFYLLHLLDVFRGIKAVEKLEKLTSALLIGALLILATIAATHFKLGNVNLVGSGNLFLPYGAIFFALWGANMIPLLAERVQKNEVTMRRLLTRGTLLIGALYIIFAVSAAYAVGTATTPDGITGLASILGGVGVYLTAIIGLLAVGNGFDSAGVVLSESLKIDFKLPRLKWPILIIPPIIFILGLVDLTQVIGLTGGVFLALDGLYILAMHNKLQPKMKKRILSHVPQAAYLFLTFVFLAGIATSIYFSFK